MRQVTLMLLVRNKQVLLALKKRGFGQGKWNGVGGKPDPGETIERTAKRETNEEIGVGVRKMKRMATIDFVFPNKAEWTQQMIVFVASDWVRRPIESEEMAPKWFKFADIPYAQMWFDDKYWLPLVLEGKKVIASFEFTNDEKLRKMEMEVG